MDLSPADFYYRLWLFEYSFTAEPYGKLQPNTNPAGSPVERLDASAIYRRWQQISSWVDAAKALHLRSLALRETSLTDEKILQCISLNLLHARLRHLDLSYAPLLTNASMKQICDLAKGLTELSIKGCYRVSDDGLIYIAEAKALRILDVSGCSSITDHGLSGIAANCRYLTRLVCNRCKGIRLEAAFFHVLRPPELTCITRLRLMRLRSIEISHCPLVARRGIQELLQSAPNIRKIHAYACPLLRNAADNFSPLVDISPPEEVNTQQPSLAHYSQRFALETAAALRIQSFFRHWKTKPASVQGLIAKAGRACTAAAVQIQRIWRGFVVLPMPLLQQRLTSLQRRILLRASQLALKVIAMKARRSAALRIQCCWRVSRSREDLCKLQEMARRRYVLAGVFRDAAQAARERRRVCIYVERAGLLVEVSPILAMGRVLGAPHGQYTLKKQVLQELRQMFLEREEERVRKHRARYQLEARWAHISACKIQRRARQALRRKEDRLLVSVQARVRGMVVRNKRLSPGVALARQLQRKVAVLGGMRLELLKAQAAHLDAHAAATQQLDTTGEELRLANAKLAIFSTLIGAGRRRIGAVTTTRELAKRLQRAHADMAKQMAGRKQAARRELSRWGGLRRQLAARVEELTGAAAYAGKAFAEALLRRVDVTILISAEREWVESILADVVQEQQARWRAHLARLAAIAHAPFVECLGLLTALGLQQCRANSLLAQQTMLLKTLYAAKRGGQAHVHLLPRLHEQIQRSRDALGREEDNVAAAAEQLLISVEDVERAGACVEDGLRKAAEVQREVRAHVWTTQIPLDQLKTAQMLDAETRLQQRKENATQMTQADNEQAEERRREEMEAEAKQRARTTRGGRDTMRSLGLEALSAQQRLEMSVLDHQSGQAEIATGISQICCSARAPGPTFKQLAVNLSPILELSKKELYLWTETSSDKSAHITGLRLGRADGSGEDETSTVLGDSGLRLEAERGGSEGEAIVEVKISGSLLEEKLFAELGLQRVKGGALTNVAKWGPSAAREGHWLWVLRKQDRGAAKELENPAALKSKLAEAEKLLEENPRSTSLQKMVEGLREKVELAKMYAERTGVEASVGRTVNYLGLSEKEVKRVLGDFRRIDVDNSGSVSVDELMGHVGLKRTPFTDKLFRFLDTSGDGTLDFAEFLHSVGTVCMFGRREITQMSFNMYDLAGLGKVNPKAIHDMMIEMHSAEAVDASRQLKALVDKILRREEVTFEDFNQLASASPFMLRPAFAFQEALMKSFFGEAWWKRRRLQYRNLRAGIKKAQNKPEGVFKLPPIRLPKIGSRK